MIEGQKNTIANWMRVPILTCLYSQHNDLYMLRTRGQSKKLEQTNLVTNLFRMPTRSTPRNAFLYMASSPRTRRGCRKVRRVGHAGMRQISTPEEKWSLETKKKIYIYTSDAEQAWKIRTTEIRTSVATARPQTYLSYSRRDTWMTGDVWGHFTVEQNLGLASDGSPKVRVVYMCKLTQPRIEESFNKASLIVTR